MPNTPNGNVLTPQTRSEALNVRGTEMNALQMRHQKVSPADLAVELWDGNYVRIGDLTGYAVMAVFLKRAGCDAPYFLYLLDLFSSAYGSRGFRAIAGLLDLQPDEAVPLITYKYPIGRANRRRVADVLGISMSGFHLPKIVFLDRGGNIHSTHGLGDAFLAKPEDNSRRVIEALLDGDMTIAAGATT